MTVDQPQEQHGEPGPPKRIDGERDVGAAPNAEWLEEQPEEPEHLARAEDETDRAPVQEQDHPERVEVLEDRPTAPSHTPARTPTSAHGDFQVFGPGELEGYRSRWESLQLGFVDDPKRAAEEADTVVGELLGRLTERHQALSDELNRQSQQDIGTESMRLAVRNYRLLFRSLVGS